MKVETGYGETWLSNIADRVRRAEEAGFDAITTGELKHNSVLALTLAAEHSERLELCTGVTIAFPRTPMIMAQTVWDLQEFSKGRINIGLGSQVKGHNVRRFGGTWTSPAKRMEDYVGMMRAVWRSWQDGEKPDYVTDHYTYTLMTPAFNPGPIDYPMPKISLASVGPRMSEAAGFCADGLRPHGFMTEKYMRETVLPAVEKGARRAGRSADELEISVGGFNAFGETESEVEQAIDALRRPISFYGSTRTYHGVFRAHGLESLGMQLHELSVKGQWDKMLEAVNFEVALEMANACTYDDLPTFARSHFDYASRISFGLGARGSAGMYGGSSEREVSAPVPSEERVRWLIKEFSEL
ncbi:MAG: TIGR03617 family F420-dependent LLM class oxidoreductase [Vicinamibacterales bacterium]|jgi:probable F420-dependent oxidoreductase|nr:TIGR03617 family F420-dependent LLM class oxidoreductase [Vicinamibacterales bacterium]